MKINLNYPVANQYPVPANMTDAQARSLDKLSSVNKINKTANDAVRLQISEMARNIFGAAGFAGMERSRAAQDGITTLQIADTGLKAINSILNRMKDLAGTQANDKEINSLKKEIDDIIKNTTFNSKGIFDGSLDEDLKSQIGADSGVSLRINIDDILSNTVESIDRTIQTVTDKRAEVTEWQKQLEDTAYSITGSEANLTAAENRIRDVNMAKAVLEFAKTNMATNPVTAKLAQSNQQIQSIMDLLFR